MSPPTRRLKWCALTVCAVAAFASAGGAGAADPRELELSALTGPAGTDLYVTAPAGTTTFERVRVQVGDTEDPEAEARILNLTDVVPQDGVATIDLGTEAAGTPVRVDAHIRATESSKILIHRGRTTIRLELPGPGRPADPRRDVARLRRDGVRYVLVTGAVADRVLAAAGDYPREARFYADLERDATRVLVVRPGGDLTGPWIALYRL